MSSRRFVQESKSWANDGSRTKADDDPAGGPSYARRRVGVTLVGSEAADLVSQSVGVVDGRLDVLRRRVLTAPVYVCARRQIFPNAHALVAFIRTFATAQIKPTKNQIND